MDPSNERLQELGRRILLARARILSEQGFFGLLLMHMKFAIGEEFDTAWVSNSTITFNPMFMDALTNDELVFVLEHEVMHAALGHLARGRSYEDQELFNLACDIVVNSNILRSNGMDIRSITLGEYGVSYHLTPKGSEGYGYTAEEVYAMFADSQGEQDSSFRWDWHITSDTESSDEEREEWIQRLREARDAMRSRYPNNERGLVPLGVERMLGELDAPRMDWRALLNDFVQEEVFDWSYARPDRRFADSPFILPSFSDVDYVIHDVLFMVDASGSVEDEDLASVYSEIRGALEQFGGKLDGWIGFFDVDAYGPTRFDTMEDLVAMRPMGGGGTRFEAAFEAMDELLAHGDVSCVVILTDGYAPFPSESMARGVPVLWLLTEDDVQPPWGRVAHLR
ncbi:MAG: hypothetical protein IKG18_14280 [Atopobiaceae bacterium]|nr:hypothetical protein [Atopobiaceae bacterium]